MFQTCFANWLATLRDGDPDIVAIDGKTSRRPHDKRKSKKPLHLVSAWASGQRLVLGQQATAEKTNEIMAIPQLVDRLVLKGSMVTTDAMGTQIEIAEKIIAKEADYCLALKENRPALYGEVEKSFADPEAPGVMRHETVDGDHGRNKTRRYAIASDIAWLASDRSYPGAFKFQGLAMIGMAENETERYGKTTVEIRYFLVSTVLTVAAFAAVVRGHWGLESRLHWVLDAIFGDDDSCLHSGHAAENVAKVRQTSLNLSARPARSIVSRSVARKRLGTPTISMRSS